MSNILTASPSKTQCAPTDTHKHHRPEALTCPNMQTHLRTHPQKRTQVAPQLRPMAPHETAKLGCLTAGGRSPDSRPRPSRHASGTKQSHRFAARSVRSLHQAMPRLAGRCATHPPHAASTHTAHWVEPGGQSGRVYMKRAWRCAWERGWGGDCSTLAAVRCAVLLCHGCVLPGTTVPCLRATWPILSF